MDTHNRYHTPSTWTLVRLEHGALMVGLILATLVHRQDLRWGPFIAAFVLIDAIGYLPGAIAFRRGGRGKIGPVYHHLYNLTHSFLTAGAVIGAWALAIGGLEWAMTAIPIHLLGDRGLFGNTYKPAALPFEPAPVDPRRGIAGEVTA